MVEGFWCGVSLEHGFHDVAFQPSRARSTNFLRVAVDVRASYLPHATGHMVVGEQGYAPCEIVCSK